MEKRGLKAQEQKCAFPKFIATAPFDFYKNFSPVKGFGALGYVCICREDERLPQVLGGTRGQPRKLASH